MIEHAKILRHEYYSTSGNANPRHSVVLVADDGRVLYTKTDVDASLGYNVGNPEMTAGVSGTATIIESRYGMILKDWRADR